MAHRGVSLEHPDNAGVIARMTKPHVIADRPGLISKLEQLQEKQPSAGVVVSVTFPNEPRNEEPAQVPVPEG